MCLCIYVYVYTCIHVYMYICMSMHICIYVYMYICIYVYMYICMSMCICICVHMNVCIYVYVYTCMSMYTCIYVFMYICMSCMILFVCLDPHSQRAAIRRPEDAPRIRSHDEPRTQSDISDDKGWSPVDGYNRIMELSQTAFLTTTAAVCGAAA